MKVIRVDNTINCKKCGSNRELLECTVQHERPNFRGGLFDEIYCNNCLNEFEKDEKNYRIID